MPDSPKKKILFIVNPLAGVGHKETFPLQVDKVIDKQLFDSEIVYTEKPDHATQLSREALLNQVDIVVAVGGDGTINEVARSLIGTGTILGLVPAGSGNGLARHLGIPLHAGRALRVINAAKTMKIDTGIINKRPFVSIAGIGFDALVAKKFAEDPHRGFITYFRIVASLFQHYKPKKYKISIEGEKPLTKRALFVSLANSNQFGYNTTIAPNAKLNDGLIDVCIVEKPAIFELPLIVNLLLLKMIHLSKHVHIYKAAKVQVKQKKKRCINLDGEAVNLDSRTMDISVNPQSLNIIIP